MAGIVEDPMSTFRQYDPYRLRAEEHGCNTCGVKGDVFYTVQFYILPSKLVRKRHKDRAQTAIYCRRCYERAEHLPYLVDGLLYS